MWALPEEYVRQIEAQEAARKRRVSKNQREAVDARLRALEREETARLEAEVAQLDAMWERLDEMTRSRIDSEVNGKLGILGRNGRGEAARIAFRRAALRDLLGQLAGEIKHDSER